MAAIASQSALWRTAVALAAGPVDEDGHNPGTMDVAVFRCCRNEYLAHQLLVSETESGNSFAGIKASAKHSTEDCEATSGYSAKLVSGVVQTQHPFPLVPLDSLIRL